MLVFPLDRFVITLTSSIFSLVDPPVIIIVLPTQKMNAGDIVLMTAAVSDFIPNKVKGKIRKMMSMVF